MPEEPVTLKPATAGREVVDDYAALGFSLKAHPVAFLRPALGRRGVVPAAELWRVRDGSRVRVAGLVLVRQRPGSAKGVMFITLEDETGVSNLIVWPALFERFRRVVLSAGMMGVEGRLQREGEIAHIIAERLVDLSPALARVGEGGPVPVPHGRADEARSSGGIGRRGAAGVIGLRLKEDYNPDLLIKRERGIAVRPRNFQ